jgi:hypothetical protein
LSVTGANSGEKPETQDPGIWLENAGFSTAVNNGEGMETDSGSVSEDSNPSPAALISPRFAGFCLSLGT